MEKLLEIMARLRDPVSGCPWDQEQTYASISPHTIEEAYEVADAIERGDLDELKDELGDLLFQVVFYAQLAREQQVFDFEDIVCAISEKMVRRHPHVFAEAQVADVAEQTQAWERQKAAERKLRSREESPSQLAGVARALPALVRAEKLQRRAAKVGFDWPAVVGVLSKVREELAEVEAESGPSPDPEKVREEVGDLLFSCVNLARHLGVDAETALRGANDKFEHRFRAMEQRVLNKEWELSELDQMALDRLWDQVKQEQVRDA
ncbi:MAG: nucleoside triphosphate pyrophosphohydrolase [Gammaproteobacteria bacterium]|nr:nucleoside triphosphate pyrophosphohydrolase [Gammaproteobacteria bacterium]